MSFPERDANYQGMNHGDLIQQLMWFQQQRHEWETCRKQYQQKMHEWETCWKHNEQRIRESELNCKQLQETNNQLEAELEQYRAKSEQKIRELEINCGELHETINNLQAELEQYRAKEQSGGYKREGRRKNHASSQSESEKNISTVILPYLQNMPTKQEIRQIIRSEIASMGHSTHSHGSTQESEKDKSKGWLNNFTSLFHNSPGSSSSKICESCQELKKEVEVLKDQAQRRSQKVNDEIHQYQGTLDPDKVGRDFKSFFEYSRMVTLSEPTEASHIVPKMFCKEFMDLTSKVQSELISKIMSCFETLFNGNQDKDVWRAFAIMMHRVDIKQISQKRWNHFGKFQIQGNASRDIEQEAIEMCTSLLVHVPPYIPTTKFTEFDERFHQHYCHDYDIKKGDRVIYFTPTLLIGSEIISQGKVCTQSCIDAHNK